ncbi:hypothetical protein PanWU01x14_149480 [Parasponia andersonii]|uniref:Uncharacterized protein n=1 Tax=Parasponia andersonii TaxID=3476 RepID=A0A2P5CIV8_PARAD|nr:hypothetical protein PanWU01x14_149480 [Parasponia andersonii]
MRPGSVSADRYLATFIAEERLNPTKLSKNATLPLSPFSLAIYITFSLNPLSSFSSPLLFHELHSLSSSNSRTPSTNIRTYRGEPEEMAAESSSETPKSRRNSKRASRACSNSSDWSSREGAEVLGGVASRGW